ncbi:hypothetical protein LWI29_008481 [Acer saccharum]|uniref:Homeobox domain-containing protein n=1 Tax=Acer saccharum TaxID=4024 RepID=A0AA39SKB2_ACESA|nr:hypothetical protein LWI29_008481 [Acer saccharum]
MEGEGEIGLQGDHLDPGLQNRNREDGYESRSGGNNNNNVEAVGSGDDHNANDDQDAHDDDQEPPRKNSHRHTSRQIQVLESFFQEFPHPDENQRTELSEKLGLECRQIKFWFQNRRTQMKTQKERHENMRLRQEHNMSRVESEMLKEAMRNPLCTSCGSLVAATGGCGGESNFELDQLRLENARLKEELDTICILANKFLGRPLTSSMNPLFQSINPSSGEGSSSAPPPPPPMAAGGVMEGNNGGGIPFDRNVFCRTCCGSYGSIDEIGSARHSSLAQNFGWKEGSLESGGVREGFSSLYWLETEWICVGGFQRIRRGAHQQPSSR